MSRKLGEGEVTKIAQNYSILLDVKQGHEVYVPIEAVKLVKNCKDMRERFKIGDVVCYSAMTSVDRKSACPYSAISAVRADEIEQGKGKIVDRAVGYCYAEVAGIGRVFIPNASRNEMGKPWMCYEATIGAIVNVKCLPQPVYNNCKYVAFSCLIEGNENISTVTEARKGVQHTCPPRMPDQIGCIVIRNEAPQESFVHSSITGLASIPARLLRPQQSEGTWIYYCAVRTDTDDKFKASWTVSELRDLGTLYEATSSSHNTCILDNIDAIVTRVCNQTRYTWLWNDFVGRITIPPHCFNPNLKPFERVNVPRAIWRGIPEDVPWAAEEVERVEVENKEDKERCARQLKTSDGWKVKFASPSMQKFCCILTHLTEGAVFGSWTDVQMEDKLLAKEAMCRVTYSRIERDKRFIFRAVLITPTVSGQPVFEHPNFNPEPSRFNKSLQLDDEDDNRSICSLEKYDFDETIHQEVDNNAFSDEESWPSYKEAVMNNPEKRPHSGGFESRAGYISPVGSGRPQGKGERGDVLNGFLSRSDSPQSLFEMPTMDFEELSRVFAPTDRTTKEDDVRRERIEPHDAFDQPQHAKDANAVVKRNHKDKGKQEAKKKSLTVEKETQTEPTKEHEIIRDILRNQDVLMSITQNLPQHLQTILQVASYHRT